MKAPLSFLHQLPLPDLDPEKFESDISKRLSSLTNQEESQLTVEEIYQVESPESQNLENGNNIQLPQTNENSQHEHHRKSFSPRELSSGEISSSREISRKTSSDEISRKTSSDEISRKTPSGEISFKTSSRVISSRKNSVPPTLEQANWLPLPSYEESPLDLDKSYSVRDSKFGHQQKPFSLSFPKENN